MNENERVEELGSSFLWGTLGERERAELEALLETGASARESFAALCTEEMLLWQALRPDAEELATPAGLPRDASRDPQPRTPWPTFPRAAAAAAALLLAFGCGWVGSIASGSGAPRSALGGRAPSDGERWPVAPILLPPPDVYLLPLDYDERGQLRERMSHNNQPLEIANL